MICPDQLAFAAHGIARDGVASGRIGRGTGLRVVDAILTGMHQAEYHASICASALSRAPGVAGFGTIKPTWHAAGTSA